MPLKLSKIPYIWNDRFQLTLKFYLLPDISIKETPLLSSMRVESQWIRFNLERKSPLGVMVKVLNCGVVVIEFKFQSHLYVYRWTNALWKGMNPFIIPAMN